MVELFCFCCSCSTCDAGTRLLCDLPSRSSAMSPSSSKPVRRRESAKRPWLRRLLVVTVVVMLGWFAWLYYQINAVAVQDEARHADAIAVFGAADMRDGLRRCCMRGWTTRWNSTRKRLRRW